MSFFPVKYLANNTNVIRIAKTANDMPIGTSLTIMEANTKAFNWHSVEINGGIKLRFTDSKDKYMIITRNNVLYNVVKAKNPSICVYLQDLNETQMQNRLILDGAVPVGKIL